MFAGVCGKRVGFEDLFGSSPKRFRYFGSSDPGFDDPVSTFSALDPELRTSIVRNHTNMNDDCKESSNVFSSGLEERNKPHSFDSVRIGNCTDEAVTCSRISDYNVEDVNDIKHKFYNEHAVESPKWTDLFVHEMMSATNIDDARARATKILKAFKGSVTSNKRPAEEIEHVSLKEHFEELVRKQSDYEESCCHSARTQRRARGKGNRSTTLEVNPQPVCRTSSNI